MEWSSLESVVVRNDYITLFHRGKKYLQYGVLQDLSELELVKMNSFCKEQIEATGGIETLPKNENIEQANRS